MKKILFLFSIIASLQVQSQKYYTRTGVTELMASVDLYDSIKIYNWSTSVVLDAKTGEFSALIFVRAFQFNKALSESIFNTDLMESDKYPKATFKGKIIAFSTDSIVDRKSFKINGELSIKGTQKKAETIGYISKKNKELWLKASFTLNPEDYNIRIPGLFRDRVGRFIDLTVYLKLKKKN